MVVGHPPWDRFRTCPSSASRTTRTASTADQDRVEGLPRRTEGTGAALPLHDAELLWIGLLFKVLGRRVVYDVHEDTPKQIMNKFWIPWWAKRVLATGTGLMERLAAATFDGVVAATPSIADASPSREHTAVCRTSPISPPPATAPRPGRASRRTPSPTPVVSPRPGLREIVRPQVFCRRTSRC